MLDDVQYPLPVYRLEVELVGHVEVGRYRFWITVDHDRLITQLAHGIHAVHAGVVELDPLSNPIRAAAENDDLLPVRDDALGLRLVGRVEVGCLGWKFTCARVDHLEGRREVERLAVLAHVHFLVIAIQ